MKTPLIAYAAVTVAGTLMLGGCVSGNRYKKLQSDSYSLRSQLAQANKRSSDLEKEVADMRDANASLAQEKDELARRGHETQSQYESLLGQLQQEVAEGNLKITQFKNMLTVDIAEQIFFDSGSARLKKGGKAVLKKVATALASYKDKAIRVVGHTDNVPLAKGFQMVFPTNWELSVIRATNVVRFLQEEGTIEPERLIAEGRGEFDPIAPNDTPEGRKKNRRIEIMLIDKAAAAAERTPTAEQPNPVEAQPAQTVPAETVPAETQPQ